MKIIFLDIDGVLNSENYYSTIDRTIMDWNRFDPKVIVYIQKIVEKFSAKIVITSTWRFGAITQLKVEMEKSGLYKYLYKDWKTPQIYPPHRGKEIKMWLEKHPEIKDYVIIDDDECILEEQMKHFIKTNLKDGMTEQHYNKISELFMLNSNLDI